MSKITNDGLTLSGTGCSIAVPTYMSTVGIKGLIFVQLSWCLQFPSRVNEAHSE